MTGQYFGRLLAGWFLRTRESGTVMRHDFATLLFNYWEKLRADRPAPTRGEVEPSDIRNLLGDTFILEISGSGDDIIYRLAGTRLCTANCRELKGTAFLSAWAKQDRHIVREAVKECHKVFVPYSLVSVARTREGREIECETILLPLLPTHDNSIRMLGLTVPLDKPYWLGADPFEEFHLQEIEDLSDGNIHEIATPERNRFFAANENVVDASAAPLQADVTVLDAPTAKRVAHLVVHEGGRSE